MHYEVYLKQTNFDIWQTYQINLNTLLNLKLHENIYAV